MDVEVVACRFLRIRAFNGERATAMSKLVPRNDRGNVIGEAHHRAQLTDADVELILYLRFEAHLTYPAICDKFDDGGFKPSRETVRDICLGKRRSQLAVRYGPAVRRKKP